MIYRSSVKMLAASTTSEAACCEVNLVKINFGGFLIFGQIRGRCGASGGTASLSTGSGWANGGSWSVAAEASKRWKSRTILSWVFRGKRELTSHIGSVDHGGRWRGRRAADNRCTYASIACFGSAQGAQVEGGARTNAQELVSTIRRWWSVV